MSEQLKYGQIKGGSIGVDVPMAAAQAISAASGKFVYMNDGAATLCDDGITSIMGHLEAAAGTPSVGDKLKCVIDPTAVYRIPVNSGTYVVGMIGDQCDISISGGIQGAQLDASVENLLIVVGGDAEDNAYVDVMVNPAVFGTGLGVDA